MPISARQGCDLMWVGVSRSALLGGDIERNRCRVTRCTACTLTGWCASSGAARMGTNRSSARLLIATCYALRALWAAITTCAPPVVQRHRQCRRGLRACDRVASLQMTWSPGRHALPHAKSNPLRRALPVLRDRSCLARSGRLDVTFRSEVRTCLCRQAQTFLAWRTRSGRTLPRTRCWSSWTRSGAWTPWRRCSCSP